MERYRLKLLFNCDETEINQLCPPTKMLLSKMYPQSRAIEYKKFSSSQEWAYISCHTDGIRNVCMFGYPSKWKLKITRWFICILILWKNRWTSMCTCRKAAAIVHRMPMHNPSSHLWYRVSNLIVPFMIHINLRYHWI